MSIHKALGLPSPYRIKASVDGWIDKTHFSIRLMASPTGGTESVFAMSESWGPWREISGAEFKRISLAIVNGV